MKIGITANMYKNGFQRYNDRRYEKLKEFGFACMDFNMADTNDDFYSFDFEKFSDYFLKEKALATASGIAFSQVHGPWRWPPQDTTPEERSERMEKMKKSIEATALLGCKYWVVHPIMPFGTEDLDLGKSEETREMNLAFIKELLKTAKQHNVTICLENMPMLRFSLATPEQILDFVNEINDEDFKICLDTGHVAVFNGLSLGDEVRKLGNSIKVLHIHDNSGLRDEHLAPHRGIIDWNDFAKALNEIGFNGVISLETLPDQSLENDKFAEECIKLGKTAKELAEKAGVGS